MDPVSMVATKGCYHFRINHAETEDMGIGERITTPQFRVGQHDWIVRYFPRGYNDDSNGRCTSVFLHLQRKSVDVSATFEFLLLDKHGNAARTTLRQTSYTFTPRCLDSGFYRFIERRQLEETYIKDGYFVLVVSIAIKYGPFDIGFPYYHFTQQSQQSPTVGNSSTSSVVFPHKRVQRFWEENKQTDVTFDVDGEIFSAHRLILAAYSPVFEAELFGSVAESNLNCIIIEEMMPSVFKAMLNFMYNGSFYVIEDLLAGEGRMSSVYFIQNLLMAADRYAVEQLKTMCAYKLVESITLDNVLSLLELAEKCICRQLKKGCLRFIADEENSTELIFTEGYIKLMHDYPSLLGELKEMADK